MEYVLSDRTVEKFVDYGVNVWGVDSGLDRFEIAHKAIAMTKEFFASLDIPATLTAVGVGDDKLQLMADKVAKKLKTAYCPLTSDEVLAINKAAR